MNATALHYHQEEDIDASLPIDNKSEVDPRERIEQSYKKLFLTAKILRRDIGIVDLPKVIASFPQILLVDQPEELYSVARFLKNYIGISVRDIPLVLQSYPALLGASFIQMQQVIAFMRAQDVPRDALPSIFRAFPALLTTDPDETMMPVVDFLRNEIGISNVGRFITRLPPVLTYSIEEELLPKWKFVEEYCQYGTYEISRFPAFFSYPLDRVIKTRFVYMKEVKRIPPRFVQLDAVLRFGDKDFAVEIAGDTDDGAAFREFADSRTFSWSRPRRKKKRRNRYSGGNFRRIKAMWPDTITATESSSSSTTESSSSSTTESSSSTTESS